MAYTIYKRGQITKYEAGVVYRAYKNNEINCLPEFTKWLYDETNAYIGTAIQRYNQDARTYDRVYEIVRSILDKDFDKANELIKNQAKEIGFNYKGFVEPSDLIEGKVNVALSDGYAGNIFLKTLESSFMNFGKLFKNILLLNLKNKIAGLLIKKDLIKLKKKFDYRNTGGAFIVGLEKVIVKAHGRSDEIAFYNALNQIKIALENNVVDIIKNKLDSFNGGKNE